MDVLLGGGRRTGSVGVGDRGSRAAPPLLRAVVSAGSGSLFGKGVSVARDLALVASRAECVEAARRIEEFCRGL